MFYNNYKWSITFKNFELPYCTLVTYIILHINYTLIYKQEQCKGPLAQDLVYQHSHYRGPRRRREKRIKNVFDKMIAENFPNLKKETEFKYGKHRVPKNMKPKRHAPRHIIIKMAKLKHKERILKRVREKQSQRREGY